MKVIDRLAIQDGQPIRDTFLPYGRQWIDQEDIEAVVEVLRSDYLTTGPKIEEFETKFAEYVGAKYAVAISNGTAALHAACFAAGIKEGDEVITSPITFAASANCILYQGGIPVFADVNPLTYNIDPFEVEKKITPRTKAIIPVHFAGQPVDLDSIHEIAMKHHLLVIEDAAHALGANYKCRKIGSISDMTTFSFHPVKHITTGEGGMITTNDQKLYEKLLLFRTHGITRSPDLLTKNDGPWFYEQQDLGYNYRLTDIQAALGISQLKKIDFFVERRKEIAEIYNEAFKNIEEIIIPFQQEGCHSSWHLYVIQIEQSMLKINRKKFFMALRAENIGVNVHYIPVYQHPYYRRNGYCNIYCKYSEAIYEKIVSLPIFPRMSNHDVSTVVNAIKKVIQNSALLER
jgi:UDP-4-amino-4,6-dideoxy-N-acetyl-beta-L-altrosamine transaminase